MKATLGPVAESIFALDLFCRNNNVAFNGWRRRVCKRLGTRLDAVQQLARTCRPVPDLLFLLEQPTEPAETGFEPDRRPQRRMFGALFEFCQVAVTPYWSRARAQLVVERDARGRIVITKGVEHMLGTLHPKLRWNAPTLEVPDERDGDVHLDGRGLLLCPSLFLADRPAVVINLERDHGTPTLVFSVPVTRSTVTALCSAPEVNDHALSALVGHTRAAALQALTESCTTSELAHRLNISSAGASQHATVLREAGLITTCRNRNTVLHAVTSLGMALLQNEVTVTDDPHRSGRVSA